MTKILKIQQQSTAEHVKQLANWMSTVESRYNEDGQTTALVADYYKHPTQNIWFFYYNSIRPNMGQIGGAMMDFFLSNYQPTGEPVVNPDVMEIVNLTNAELEAYAPNDPE